MPELMLFPLNSVVLPQGKMSLRIFEPRYLRLVKLCCSEDLGFGICLVNGRSSSNQSNISAFGTMVKVIDFELLPNGLLGITVVGSRRFRIEQIWSEFDGLRKARVTYLNNWPVATFNQADHYLSAQLEKVYEQFPQLNKLYAKHYFDDASWVTQRWLELLPLDYIQFELLASSDSCERAINFLRNAIDISGNRETS